MALTKRQRRLMIGTVAALLLLAAWLMLRGWEHWEDQRGYGMLSVPVLVAAALTPAAFRFRPQERVALPQTVGGRVLSPDLGLRVRMAVVLAIALALPVAVLAALTFLLHPLGWLLADLTIVLAVAGALAGRAVRKRQDDRTVSPPHQLRSLLDRVCIAADVYVPPLRFHDRDAPAAWAEDGEIHVTRGLWETLGPGEVEAVLAHELVHLARGDAFVMDVVTAPSRHLLSGVFAAYKPWRLYKDLRFIALSWFAATVYLLPALALAGTGRLLGAGLSRGRELSADATAVVITGSPAALAAALLKLDPTGAPPLEDLRGRGALNIVAVSTTSFPLLRTHPSIAERVERLQAMEARLQA